MVPSYSTQLPRAPIRVPGTAHMGRVSSHFFSERDKPYLSLKVSSPFVRPIPKEQRSVPGAERRERCGREIPYTHILHVYSHTHYAY